jgi:DNA replication and repair protein RecF
VQYQPQLETLLDGEAMSFDRPDAVAMLRAAILASRRREIGAGTSLVGPHRDDFEFRLDGLPASAFGSRAQQRLSALALRLGEAQLIQERTQDAPVLLLDDILSELDHRRSESVIAAISEYEQSLITSAEQDRFPASFLAQASVRELQNGVLGAGG